MTLPAGYALLRTKKVDKPKKAATVKELKAQADKLKPVVPPSGYILAPPPDFTSNPKGEGLYSMFGRTGAGDAVGQFNVPYGKVQDALKSGATFYEGSGDTYSKDKEAEGKPVSWYQKILQSPSLQPVPNNNKNPDGSFHFSPIDNVDRAAARTILATPAYIKQLVDAAKSMHEGNVSGGDEFASLVNPFQLPKQLYDQYQEDAKKDPKMAMDNLTGNLLGLAAVGGVTHGVEKGVGKGVSALRDKFTPVTEPVSRERTNVLHRNGAGEVRQAKGEAPTVWLSPDAWHSLMTELYPEENPAETHGFNLPANDALAEFATNHQPATPNPMFGDVQRLLSEAHKNAGDGGIAIGKKRGSLQANVNVMREELNHTWQRGLANGNVNQHLDPQAFTNLYQAIPSGMYDHLLEHGYDGRNTPEIVAEAAAKLMDGRPERFGVDEDDAVDFLDRYFKAVTDKHGAKALEELHHVRGIAAEAKARAIEEHGRTRAGQDNNAVSGVAGGRQGRYAEGVQAEGQVNPVADPLFNREKDKPIWYLKSEKLIGEKMRGPMPGQDVSKMLLAGGVKPEEMHWTGLEDFLKSKGNEKVTPQEIKDHLAENNLQIKEITKGGQFQIKTSEDNPDEFDVVDASGRVRFSGNSREEAQDYIDDEDNSRGGNGPKYGSYVLPGGEPNSYRELLLIGPDSADRAPAGSRAAMGLEPGQDFRSSHWDEPNILAHVRFNDRTGPNGENLLHVEEVQSDWHQKGREVGYVDQGKQEQAKTRINELAKKMTDAYEGMKSALERNDRLGFDTIGEAKSAVVGHPDWAERWDVKDKDDIEAIDAWANARRESLSLEKKGNEVPDAPFKKTWHEMALRRILKMAADKGYDGVSWTPGEDQADRYSLSHQVDRIAVPKVDVDGSRSVRIEPIGGGTDFKMSVSSDGTVDGYYNASQFTGKKLDEVIGKKIARKVMEAKEPTNFEGEGLKVGGEGMRGFYDKIVPDYLNKFGKRYGAKVGETQIGVESYNEPFDPARAKVKERAPGVFQVWVGNDEGGAQIRGGNFDTKEEAENYARTGGAKTVQYLPITPEMRQSVGEEGVPLFNRTILKEERPDAPDTKAKREELQKRYTQLAQDMKRLDSEGDVWRDIVFDYGKYSKEEREAAWEEKKKARDEWWEKLSEHRKVESELKKMDDPRIGELREDSSGRKTLWLSKDAMWVVQYATSPGIINAFSDLRGVSYKTDDIPKLILNIDRHFGPNNRQANIIPQVKKLLTEAANQAGKEGVTIVGATGRGFSETAKTAREEMNHAWQRAMSADGDVGSHLKPEVFEDLNEKIPLGVKLYLKAHKYQDNPVNNVVETAAKIMSGAGKDLTASLGEQSYWLHDYFQAVIDEHGPQAFNTLDRIMGFAKLYKEEALSGKENIFNLSKRAGNQGTLGSQPEGGSERDSGGDGDSSGKEALFNREQVKTPEFKNWFGDSKVVDEKAEPKVVYHGTVENFDTFNQGELGFHFGTSDQANDRGGTISMPVYLSLKNPAIVTDDPGYWGRLSALQQFVKDGIITKDESSELRRKMDESDEKTAKLGGRDERAARFKVMREYLKNKGYDGVSYPNKFEGHEGTSYIAFDPEQIKSAIGNSGKFDPKDPSILRNREKVEKSPEFVNWFGDSKSVDEDGKPKVFYHGTTNNFTAFAPGRGAQLGSHFGTPEQANARVKGFEDYGYKPQVMPVYLSIKNPLRLTDYGDFSPSDVAPQLKDMGIIDENLYNDATEGFGKKQDLDRKLKNAIKKKGYDGVVYLNRREGSEADDSDNDLSDEEFKAKYPDAQESWIAFSPTQVKSAIGNSGAFDPKDPSILRNREKLTKDQEHWINYTKNTSFDSEQEARDWTFRRKQNADEQYGSMFGVSGPEKNRAFADSLPIRKEGKKFKIGPKPSVSTDRLGSQEPDGDSPAVDWEMEDLQDSGKAVDEESILRDYGGGKPGKVYRAYVDPSILEPKLAEEEDEDGGTYDWDELNMSQGRKPVPPAKILVRQNGKVEILDGNHRISYWQDKGFDSIPAWVIDRRKGVNIEDDAAFNREKSPDPKDQKKGIISVLDRDAAVAIRHDANLKGKHKDSPDGLNAFYKGMPQGEYVKVRIPLDRLDHFSQNEKREQEYADRPGEFPPIYVTYGESKFNRNDDGTGYVADGNHRAVAAGLRGDKDILAIMPKADYERFMSAGQSSVESNTNTEESAEKTPEPVDRSSTGTAPVAVIPIQGNTQLASAPIMIPPVPTPQKKALPLAEIKAQAAGLNPNHTQVKSVRQLMAEARTRMIP
ncbi:unnamed protein product [Sphagnum balticum]